LAYGYAQYGYPQWRNFRFTTNVSGGESGAVNASICVAWLTKVRNRAITEALWPQAGQRGGRRLPAPAEIGGVMVGDLVVLPAVTVGLALLRRDHGQRAVRA